MRAQDIGFVEEGNRLVIRHVSPATGSLVVEADDVRRLAALKGYGDWLFDHEALESAARALRTGQGIDAAVASRLDAQYKVEVDAHKMIAWLTIERAHAGKSQNAHDAVAALAYHRVCEGVDAVAVEAALADCGQRKEVARGTLPVPGKDAVLEPLVEVNRQRHPHIDATGHVDLHDLGAIPAVQAGQPVMRRHPPQPGLPGRNVFGENIPAAAGRDARFAVRLQGVMDSPDDPDLLLAEIAGQPLLHKDGITVEPILRYDSIDIATGNVDFPGSVVVLGDIRSGMKVSAGGDITVQGVIESAEVAAGGDIRVLGGIIGHACAQHSAHQPIAQCDTARVSAHGNVCARYIENAIIEAQQTVRVTESIVQSEVTALDQIVVGGKGQKGRILGGLVRATGLVSVDYLGGDGAGPTRVMVGINPLLQRAMHEHRKRKEDLLKQHDDVTKIVKLLKGHSEKREIYDKARLTLKKISEDIAEEMDDEQVLEAEGKLAEHAKVVIGEAVAAGVTITMGRRSVFVNEDSGRGVFHLEAGGEIGFSTFARGSRMH